jgi:hypothetical protein
MRYSKLTEEAKLIKFLKQHAVQAIPSSLVHDRLRHGTARQNLRNLGDNEFDRSAYPGGRRVQPLGGSIHKSII